MNRPARLHRRLWKGALAAATLGPAAAYLVWAMRAGRIRIFNGAIHLQTGDYHWDWALDQFHAVAWALALGLLAALGLRWPWGVKCRKAKVESQPIADCGLRIADSILNHRSAIRHLQFIPIAVAWGAALALAAMQWLRIPALGFGEWVFVFAIALPAAWLSLRGAAGRRSGLERLGAAWARPAGVGTFVFFFALGAIAAALACRFIYRGHPLVTDAESQIAQARLLLSGHARLDVSQALRDAISFPYATNAVPSFSQYPPGHILLILPWIAAGLPAQVWTALASGLTAGLTALVAGRVAGGAAARAAGLLTACSPFFLALGGGAMNHMTAALALTATVWCWLPAGAARGPRLRCALAWLGGLALGWAVMTRPLTAFAHGLVWAGAWAILWLEAGRAGQKVESPKPKVKSQKSNIEHRLSESSIGNRQSAIGSRRALGAQALWALAGLALPAAIFLYYNHLTTGHAFTTGYEASNSQLHRLGFRTDGPYPYTPAQAIHNLAANVASLNALMFGWAVGSWTLGLIWWTRTRLARGERILVALIAVQTFAYFLYHFHDLFIGPRFLFEWLPLAAVLASAGLAAILRCGGRRAGVLWVMILTLSISGAAAGLDFWRGKYADIVARHERLDRFVRSHEPLAGPTVFVVPGSDAEMVGRYFPALPGEPSRWFVLADRADRARALPELRDAQWIEYR